MTTAKTTASISPMSLALVYQAMRFYTLQPQYCRARGLVVMRREENLLPNKRHLDEVKLRGSNPRGPTFWVGFV